MLVCISLIYKQVVWLSFLTALNLAAAASGTEYMIFLQPQQPADWILPARLKAGGSILSKTSFFTNIMSIPTHPQLPL
jgi:hypothetical protein